MYFDDLKIFLSEQKQPSYRYQQIVQAIFRQKITDFNQIKVLPKTLRSELATHFGYFLKDNLAIKESADQATKVLFRFPDGEKVEAVEMSFEGSHNGKRWKSLCLSSQVGCNLGCAFCATGKIGLHRNLTADEILQQVLYFELYSGPLHSISFMGMGEALLNSELFTALRTLTDHHLFNFSQRKLTVSTSGIVPGLRNIIEQFPHINLAFSLHSPFETERAQLMPIAKRYSTKEVMEILDQYIMQHHRKVFISYIMLQNINDSEKHLKALINFIKSRHLEARPYYHLNLIRYNSIPGDNFSCSPRSTIDHFIAEIAKAGICCTLRQSFGRKISAACGQLYGKYHIA